MGRAARLGILVGVLTAIEPTAAQAQEATNEREAQARFEEGLARVRAGNYEGARASFLQAYAVLQKPYILWNLALAEEKTGSTLAALGHFKQFARVGPAGEDRSVAEKHIADLMGQTGHLDVAAPTGAQVILDGAPAGAAPLGENLDVLPGRHHLEVQTAQGTREAVPEVAAGQFVRVNLMPAASSPSASSSIELTSGAAHEANAPLSQANEHASSGVQSPDASGSSKARLISVALLGATSAALVGVGAYFALQSQNEANTVDRYKSNYGPSWCFQSSTDPCAAWNDAVRAQSRDATASNVLYVAGGVLAAGAVATWFLWPKATTSVAVGMRLALGVSGTALYAKGQF